MVAGHVSRIFCSTRLSVFELRIPLGLVHHGCFSPLRPTIGCVPRTVGTTSILALGSRCWCSNGIVRTGPSHDGINHFIWAGTVAAYPPCSRSRHETRHGRAHAVSRNDHRHPDSALGYPLFSHNVGHGFPSGDSRQLAGAIIHLCQPRPESGFGRRVRFPFIPGSCPHDFGIDWLVFIPD